MDVDGVALDSSSTRSPASSSAPRASSMAWSSPRWRCRSLRRRGAYRAGWARPQRRGYRSSKRADRGCGARWCWWAPFRWRGHRRCARRRSWPSSVWALPRRLKASTSSPKSLRKSLLSVRCFRPTAVDGELNGLVAHLLADTLAFFQRHCFQFGLVGHSFRTDPPATGLERILAEKRHGQFGGIAVAAARIGWSAMVASAAAHARMRTVWDDVVGTALPAYRTRAPRKRHVHLPGGCLRGAVLPRVLREPGRGEVERIRTGERTGSRSSFSSAKTGSQSGCRWRSRTCWRGRTAAASSWARTWPAASTRAGRTPVASTRTSSSSSTQRPHGRSTRSSRAWNGRSGRRWDRVRDVPTRRAPFAPYSIARALRAQAMTEPDWRGLFEETYRLQFASSTERRLERACTDHVCAIRWQMRPIQHL